MKKRRKSKSRSSLVKHDIFRPCLTVEELREEISEATKRKTKVYVDIGGPKLRVLYSVFYPSGIEGEPSLILKVEDIKAPEHTSFETALARQMIEFLRIAGKKE